MDSKKKSSSSDSQDKIVEKANPVVAIPPSTSSASQKQQLAVSVTSQGLGTTFTTVQQTSKINRTFAVYTKGSDPAQCLEYIDEIYELFNENEVCRKNVFFQILTVI